MSRPRILVVEDNPVTRKLLRLTLVSEGYDVVEAASAAEALRAIAQDLPALALCDLVLPDADGFEVLERIRKLPGAAHVPVLSYSGVDDERRILSAGFSDHLLKPIEPSKVVEAIAVHLARAKVRSPKRRHSGLDKLERVSLIWNSSRQVLARLSEVRAHELGVEKALGELLTCFLDACGFTMGAAFLASELGEPQLRSCFGTQAPKVSELKTFFGQEALLQRSLGRGEPEVIDRGDPSEAARTVFDAWGAGSMLLIPLEQGGIALGVLVLASPNPKFSPDWLELAKGLAGPMAQTVTLAELARHANRDALTGLLTRRRFEEELAVRIAESKRYGTSGALILIDLDRFKPINDTWGHAAGDAVLKYVGDVLRASTRDSDLSARIGGDEFAVLLPHADEQGALACAEKIRRLFATATVEVGREVTSIAASIGIATYPEHGFSRERLFEAADSALYEVKRAGRNGARVAGSDWDLEYARTAPARNVGAEGALP